MRSHKLLAAGIAVVILAGLAGGSYVAYGQVKSRADRLQALLTSDLQAGQQELEAGKTALTQANSKHDPSLVAQAVAHFDAAKGHFLAASQAADGSRLLHDLELVPAAGDLARSRHTAVDGISAMGVALSDAGKDVSDLDAQLLKPPGTGQASRNLLTVLNETQTSLVKVKDDLVQAQKAAASVDLSVVPAGQQAAFTKARGTIDTALAGMDEFQRLAPVLKDILGGNGVRNYLIEQVNPSELRAGGGFIGTYSILKTDNGTLTLVSSGDSYQLADPRPLPGQAGFIPQPTPYREVVPQVSWSFVDSNIYPDFPSNAEAAEQFVEPRIGYKLDGVISMDYYTVAQMLDITGPMTVPGYGLTVSGSNFVREVTELGLTDPTHKALLSALAGPLMETISSLPAERWPALISALNGLAGGRHIQSYFNNKGVEAEFDRIGWSGRVNPTAAPDIMMEIEDNYYGDKANYFIKRRVTVVLTRNGNDLHHTVVVDLANSEPFGTEERVSYKADIRLLVSANATAASDTLRTVKFADPVSPAGTTMMDGWIDVDCCGGKGQAVFEYDTPWAQGNRGPHQIYWQKQPGTANDMVEVDWNNGASRSYRAAGILSQDLIITLDSSSVVVGAAQPAAAALPSLSLG